MPKRFWESSRNRPLASRLRSKDSRAVLRGAVGKAFPIGKQLAGRLPYCTSGLGLGPGWNSLVYTTTSY